MAQARTLLDPTAELAPGSRPRAPRLPGLAGTRVALVDISKPRGDVFLDRLQQVLERRGVEVDRYAKPTHTRPAPADLRHQITVSSGAVIQALAD